MMKPVAIFRHARTEHAGYFATFLDENGIPMRVVKIDEGDAIPTDPGEFSGMALMGGPMSVNDDLPWIAAELHLIRQAVERGIPVLGHCLGGQLMSKALGGTVGRNPVKEIGWGEVAAADNAEARAWFGGLEKFPVFHWHGETFTIPDGATRILGSIHCANQAFALGPHLGLQCHVEMTEDMVRTWCRGGAAEVAQSLSSPGVQPVEAIQEYLTGRVAKLNAVAKAVYAKWIEGLERG